MNTQDFSRLREGEPGCPSDLLLDRLQAGELSPAESRQIAAHVEACTTCPVRQAARQAGFAAFPEVDPRPLLAGIRRRLHEATPEPASRRWLRQLGLIFAPLAAVTAALAVFMLVRQEDPDRGLTSTPGAAEPQTDETRAKGGLGLHVYRLAESTDQGTAARSQGAASGDRFAPGDRLRFVVDLPSRGQVTIVGIEQSGSLYVAWPTADSSPGGAALSLRSAGSAQELPGAVALDSSPGRETLYLVHCPQEGALPQCTSQGSAAHPQCPSGCKMVPFVINKGS